MNPVFNVAAASHAALVGAPRDSAATSLVEADVNIKVLGVISENTFPNNGSVSRSNLAARSSRIVWAPWDSPDHRIS